MLDFVYYPVSGVLWLWHTAFASVLGGGVAWTLAVIFLVVTLRALLLRPFLAQARFQRALGRMAPELQRIRDEHAGDQVRQAEEWRRLQRDHGVNWMSAFLPIVMQGLVFLGLFHVLRCFTDANAAIGNYVFTAEQVGSFLAANLFTAPLSESLSTAGDTFGSVALVVIPLVLCTAAVTHLTARAAIRRQPASTSQQTKLLNTLSLWVFPLGAIAAAAIMPVAILVYFATNALWTLGQQHFVSRHIPVTTDS
ncbi:membrane protein insertase YidC [Nocardia sp. NPDC050406]|uniref:membrane protein insertase YidC n=1 Tax=Nocardia sp. NPDC050406 TaxID=3364318 RepID=UPI003792FCE0